MRIFYQRAVWTPSTSFHCNGPSFPFKGGAPWWMKRLATLRFPCLLCNVDQLDNLEGNRMKSVNGTKTFCTEKKAYTNSSYWPRQILLDLKIHPCSCQIFERPAPLCPFWPRLQPVGIADCTSRPIYADSSHISTQCTQYISVCSTVCTVLHVLQCVIPGFKKHIVKKSKKFMEFSIFHPFLRVWRKVTPVSGHKHRRMH